MDRNQGDINPLSDLGENDFTDELIDFFENKKQQKENINIQNLTPKKMEFFSLPVQVEKLTAEQSELQQKGENKKLKLTPEQEKSIPTHIEGNELNKKQKTSLYFDELKLPNSDISYFVDKNLNISKNSGTEDNKVVNFITFEDVKFNMKNAEINPDNFDYLKNSLKYLGFGENLNSALEARLQQGNDKFTLGVTAQMETPVAKDLINYELRFSKSSTTDKYFLNNYQASLEKGLANGNKAEAISQVFTLNKGNDITAKEAYNLLAGRAIQKKAEIAQKPIDGVEQPKVKQDVWLKLDFDKKLDNGSFAFKSFYQNYGFNLQDSLKQHPIKELNDPDKRERLIASLNRGNLQSVTLEKNGVDEKAFISANPQYKNLNVYDKDMKLQFEKQQDVKVDNQETKSRGR